MNQKLSDFKLLLQNDRRIWVGAGVVLIGLVVVMMIGDVNREPRRVLNEKLGSPSTSAETSYRDLARSMRERVDQQQQALKEHEEAIGRLASSQEKFQEEAKGIFGGMVDKLNDLNNALEDVKKNQTAKATGQTGNVAIKSPKNQQGQNLLQPYGFEKANVPPAPKKPTLKKVKVISPGDVVPLLLLTGVNAPVDGTPYPVVFKVTGPVNGPDGSSLEIGEARLLAAAIGSETDGRVLYRLTNLSLRHPDGRRIVVGVDGWVIGEDGIRGMKGKLIDKLGRLILATFGTSFAAALGNRVDSKSNSINIENSEGVTVDSDDLEAALGSAFSDANARLVDVLIDRYEKLVPVVEVLSGREAHAVFSKTSEISIMSEDEEEGIYAASLD